MAVSVTAEKRKQTARLRGTGHSMSWASTGRAEWLGTCRFCGGQVSCDQNGSHWRGGFAGGPPSLLKYMGVNIVRRCPEARK